MSEEAATVQGAKPKTGSCIIRLVLLGVLLFLFTGLTGSVVLAEAPYHLLLGWFLHGREAIPPLLGKWRMLLLPVACLLLCGFLTHRFIRWWVSEKAAAIRWRLAHTLAAIALLLLTSGAAIAMSAIVHQFAWLASSPLTESNINRSRIHAINQVRQIQFALLEYQVAHDRYPDSLDELKEIESFDPEWLDVETEPGGIRERFVFLKPGVSGFIPESDAVIVSPVIDSMIVVGYPDSSVRTLPAIQLEQILDSYQAVPPK